jgi:hypothetical protein
MESMSEPPTSHTLEVDTRVTFQEILGFGGAFTEATAINWRKLSKADQDEVIRLYFAPPEQGGHGYTLGRVPSACRAATPSRTRPPSMAHDTRLQLVPQLPAPRPAPKRAPCAHRTPCDVGRRVRRPRVLSQLVRLQPGIVQL